jgi:cell division protein FtsZ
MGKAMMGTGEADGEHRAIEAAERAIANPLLDDISMKGARGVLINITGGPDLTLFEVDEAANRIREEVDPEANIIVGSTLDQNMQGKMRVSVVATGIDAAAQQMPQPQTSPSLRLVTPPQAKPIAFGAMPRPAQTVAAQVQSPAMPVASQPMTAGATALAMPEAAPVTMEASIDLPAPADLPEVEFAPVAQPVAQPAVAVAATPAFEPAAARPFAAQLAEAQAVAPQFVPPAAQPLPTRAPEALRQPDPFAEADMVNKPAEPKKKASLFDRITGVARRAEPEVQQAMRQAEPQFSRPAAPVAQPMPQAPVQQPMLQEPVAQAPMQAAVQPAPRQADLGLIAATERPAPSRPQDDLLDIPAFLRRQAN